MYKRQGNGDILDDMVKNEPLEADVKDEVDFNVTSGPVVITKDFLPGRRMKSKGSNKPAHVIKEKRTRRTPKKKVEYSEESLENDSLHEDFGVNFDDEDMDLEEKQFNGSYDEGIDEDDVNGKGLNTCQKCGREYKSKYPYYKHIQRCHHGKEVAKFSENCQICLKNFDQKKHLDRHMDFHRSKHDLDQPISCPECHLQLQTKYK